MKHSVSAWILVWLFVPSAIAQGTNERYDPYSYLPDFASISVVNATSDGNSTIVHVDPTIYPAEANATEVAIVGVEPPPSTKDVPYIANVFYGNWHQNSSSALAYSIDDIPWDLVGSVTYGFISVPRSNFDSFNLSSPDSDEISQLVQKGQENDVDIILSLGGHIHGGSYSVGFQPALNSSESISAFVKGVTSLVEETNVDGIEFNWEHSGCSSDSPYTSESLSTSFLIFLTDLRRNLPEGKTISLAVGPEPFQTPQLIAGGLTDAEVEQFTVGLEEIVNEGGTNADDGGSSDTSSTDGDSTDDTSDGSESSDNETEDDASSGNGEPDGDSSSSDGGTGDDTSSGDGGTIDGTGSNTDGTSAGHGYSSSAFISTEATPSIRSTSSLIPLSTAITSSSKFAISTAPSSVAASFTIPHSISSIQPSTKSTTIETTTSRTTSASYQSSGHSVDSLTSNPPSSGQTRSTLPMSSNQVIIPTLLPSTHGVQSTSLNYGSQLAISTTNPPTSSTIHRSVLSSSLTIHSTTSQAPLSSSIAPANSQILPISSARPTSSASGVHSTIIVAATSSNFSKPPTSSSIPPTTNVMPLSSYSSSSSSSSSSLSSSLSVLAIIPLHTSSTNAAGLTAEALISSSTITSPAFLESSHAPSTLTTVISSKLIYSSQSVRPSLSTTIVPLVQQTSSTAATPTLHSWQAGVTSSITTSSAKTASSSPPRPTTVALLNSAASSSRLMITSVAPLSTQKAVSTKPSTTSTSIETTASSTTNRPMKRQEATVTALGGTPLNFTSLDTGNSSIPDGSSVANTVTASYRNVSEIARVVDWITILNFDVTGPWTKGGHLVLPNSPLNSTCSSSSVLGIPDNSTVSSPIRISATSAVASWALSGFRADQIVLGVSTAGRSYVVGNITLEDQNSTSTDWPEYDETVPYLNSGSNASYLNLGDEWWWGESQNGTDVNGTSVLTSVAFLSNTTGQCGSTGTSLSDVSGVFTFKGLIDAGYLDEDGDVTANECIDDQLVVEGDYVGLWDECSETPFVYNQKTGILISYDDSESMELKGEFILKTGLRGFSMWEIGGDSPTSTLLTAIRHGAGFPETQVCSDGEQLQWQDVRESEGDESLWDWEILLQDSLTHYSNHTVNAT